MKFQHINKLIYTVFRVPFNIGWVGSSYYDQLFCLRLLEEPDIDLWELSTVLANQEQLRSLTI